MRKYFLSIVALAAGLFATSCQESIVEPQIAGPTTFTVQLPDAMGTKAAIGSAANVTDLYYEVYSNGSRIIKANTKLATTGATNVELSLIQDQSYDIYFWAQNEGAYNVDDLKKIPIHNANHNTERRAAFFHVEKNFVPSGTSTPIVLVRPFSQLNLGATTLTTDAETFSLKESSIIVKGVAEIFNTYNGVGEGTQDLVFEYAKVPNATLNVSNKGYYYISMDYFAVSGDEKALVEVEANIKSEDGKVINHTFTNVPVQENYRTNIIGNLISSTTDFQVTIDDNFVADENGNIVDNKYHVVDNVAAANTVLAAGETYVAINYIENGETIDLPNAAEYYLQIPAVDAKLNIEGDQATKVYITLVEDNSAVNGIELNIDTPSATVTVSKVGNPKVKNITASTAPNTLILDGIIVADVVIKQGNVIVENGSELGKIDNESGNDITIYVDSSSEVGTYENVDQEDIVAEEKEEGDIKFITSAAKLQQLAESVYDGNNFAGQTITLLADIDLNNVEWTSIGTEDNYFAGTFDGNGHTIKNLTIVETEAKEGKAFIGFFGYAKNATIKNITFENVYLNIACLDIDHSQGHIGAVAGSLEGTSTIEDVTVKGDIKVESTVTANGASRVAVVAGGNSYGNVTMKNVHVIANEGSYLKANNNVGALAGQLQGKSVFENCSSNIDVTGTKFFAGGIIGLAAGDQLFTNCRTTGDVKITAGREGRAHDQYRVGGIAGGWADGAKNVCTLVNCSYSGEISGKNSDGSVANPLDYAGYVGRGYTLNGCQGSKVVINGVEYVQAFNTAAEAGIYYIDGALTINSAAQLKIIADMVNNGTNYFEGKTIRLGADIDLNNVEWTPIGNSSNRFKGTFDGNNHTISNLVVEGGSSSDQGLFGFTEVGEIKNLIVNNAKVSGRLNVGVVAGTPYTSKYTNIKVIGHVEVNGMAYVGGVAGKNAYANWKDIKVEVDETSFVYANSVEDGTAYRTYVGGVVGFNGEGGHSFTDITSNIDVKGSTCDVGGLFGIAHYGNNFVNCSSSGDVEIYAADDIDSAEEIGGIAGVWHNADGQTVTFTQCSFSGTLKTNVEGVDLSDNDITGKAYSSTGNGKLIIDGVTSTLVNSLEELNAAIKDGYNVIITNNIAVGSTETGSNSYGATGISQLNGGVIDGNGNDISVDAWTTWDSAINTTGGTIKNLNVTGGMRGIFVNHNSTNCGKVVLENVTIDGTVYTISCDQGTNNGLEANNSIFNGWTSYAATIGDVKFVDCSFGEGQGYSYCRPYAPTTFVGCDFCEGYTVDPVAAVTFENCTINGVALTAGNISALVTSTDNVIVK